MALEPLSPATFAFIAQVESAYARLPRSAHPGSHLDSALGGKLLYAHELDAPGRAFVVAANIAGAATLAACADASAARQAMRDGIVDFLVNSLDEALRILKNQVRKREPGAVCVSAAHAAVEAEMRERGVVPDFTLAEITPAPVAADQEKIWLTWRVAEAPALWLPKLDALALACLSPEDVSARRWLERAPRYLGRPAQNVRTLHTTAPTSGQIAHRFRDAASSGKIGVGVELTSGPWPNPAQSP
jgi:hypothetical protein